MPACHIVQDEFLDRMYWTPASTTADDLGLISALGNCVVYDSLIHGSWELVRERASKSMAIRER
jgi:chitosanase